MSKQRKPRLFLVREILNCGSEDPEEFALDGGEYQLCLSPYLRQSRMYPDDWYPVDGLMVVCATEVHRCIPGSELLPGEYIEIDVRALK